MNDTAERNENVLAGIVGAFLFSLAGAVFWFVLDLAGFFAAISGLIGAICAMQGYKVFAGRLSKKGVVISAIVAMLVLVLAWYACFVKDLYLAYEEWYKTGEVYYWPSYFECFQYGHYFLAEPEIGRVYYGNLALGLGLAALGSAKFIIDAFSSADSQPQPAFTEVVTGELKSNELQTNVPEENGPEYKVNQ